MRMASTRVHCCPWMHVRHKTSACGRTDVFPGLDNIITRFPASDAALGRGSRKLNYAQACMHRIYVQSKAELRPGMHASHVCMYVLLYVMDCRSTFGCACSYSVSTINLVCNRVKRCTGMPQRSSAGHEEGGWEVRLPGWQLITKS